MMTFAGQAGEIRQRIEGKIDLSDDPRYL